MKYPIGIQTFAHIQEDGFVYVDKTDLIYSLAQEGKIYFLSRPRRFGKSLLISTLESYFLGRKELFKGLKIDSLEKEWLTYPVFRMDFNGSDFTKNGVLEERLKGFTDQWEKQYAVNSDKNEDLGTRFCKILSEAHRQTGRRAVVLIDEYDKPILDVLDRNLKIVFQGNHITLEERNRDILKGFYSTFKAADSDLKFVLLTGVTKFSQVSVFSGFNQPNDISMARQYETLCGITQEELVHYFSDAVKRMSEWYKCTVDEMYSMLKAQYDGYHFSSNLTGVYNPFSLLNAFQKEELQDYWFKTGTPSYLIRLMNHFDEELDDMTGKFYSPEEFADYKADVERPLPMIYQSGYLTIKDFNRRRGSFMLDFPNNEVKRGFLTLVTSNYLRTPKSVNNWLQDATDALQDGQPDTFHKLLTSFLASVPYSMRRKENEREKERYFHYTFYLLLRLISVYTVYTEKQQSQGRVDCIIETQDYIYIFEFKLDGTADEALKQIEEKGYAKPYGSDARKLYKIGVSFSSETGTVEDFRTAERFTGN